MTLFLYTQQNIDDWETKLLNASAELRKIRQILQENQLSGVMLEATRASEMIEKIETWAIGAHAKARQEAAVASAKKTREQIKERRKKSSKD